MPLTQRVQLWFNYGNTQLESLPCLNISGGLFLFLLDFNENLRGIALIFGHELIFAQRYATATNTETQGRILLRDDQIWQHTCL